MMANISAPEFCYVQSADKFISVINNNKQNFTGCSLFTITYVVKGTQDFW